ncbi:type 2 periplasmic-binding domain-containing protein [Undibacterium flavidum]|uniref:Transporter substrate-binding domain-containing protein n=1 Tax=Undibacterium flavidum TaxID=2762297 RepID=A0ABR6YE03_9BURK|nr:transporter substrate-binding domain-containing protein [Undibacterium flavidum]MBC3874791.1 transporter substrate-binding domain-containing protein [Undibacterium flavidum]
MYRRFHLQQMFGVFCVLCLLSFIPAQAQEPLEIRLPKLDVKNDPTEDYVRELLQAIVQHSARPYQLIKSPGRMLQARSIYEMTRENGNIDILWTMTTDDREKKLIPIRLPIEKGLLGWRISLITEKNKAAFSTVKRTEDLQQFTAGQGKDWPDVGILKANQLSVLTSNAYDPLFAMLAAGRFDYFPRSVFEIWGDVKHHSEHKFIVEESFILHYQTACYFFVTPRRPQLAEDLRLGFEKIIANGIFEHLFQKYHKASIERAKFKQRVVINLKNPLLNPASMALNRTELWFHP